MLETCRLWKGGIVLARLCADVTGSTIESDAAQFAKNEGRRAGSVGADGGNSKRKRREKACVGGVEQQQQC